MHYRVIARASSTCVPPDASYLDVSSQERYGSYSTQRLGPELRRRHQRVSNPPLLPTARCGLRAARAIYFERCSRAPWRWADLQFWCRLE